MEISDEVEIQIFHTIEHVKRMNEAIRRHRLADEASPFMIEQFLDIRNRLYEELQQLLLQVTETPWKVAA